MKMGEKYGASKTTPPLKAGKGIKVKESRLNKGGDEAYKGKRGKVAKKSGNSSSMKY